MNGFAFERASSSGSVVNLWKERTAREEGGEKEERKKGEKSKKEKGYKTVFRGARNSTAIPERGQNHFCNNEKTRRTGRQ
jgi:hypothetical protein